MKITDEKRDHIVNMVMDELYDIYSPEEDVCTDIINMILRELEIDVICDGEGPKN